MFYFIQAEQEDCRPYLLFFRPAADNFEVFSARGVAAKFVAGLAVELVAGRFTEDFSLILVSAPLPGFFQYFLPSGQRRFTQNSSSGLSPSSFNLNSFQPQVSQVLSSRVNFPAFGTE